MTASQKDNMKEDFDSTKPSKKTRRQGNFIHLLVTPCYSGMIPQYGRIAHADAHNNRTITSQP